MSAPLANDARGKIGTALIESIGNSIEKEEANYKRRNAFHCRTTTTTTDHDDDDDVDYLQQNLAANAKRVLLTKIDFVEIENGGYSGAFDALKAKCKILRPDDDDDDDDDDDVDNYSDDHKNCYRLHENCSAVKFNDRGGNDINSNGITTYREQLHAGMPTQQQQHQQRQQQHQHQHQHQQLATAAAAAPCATNKSSNELPTPKRILYPREFIRLGWRGTGRRWNVGAGMQNVGNTCYLNSTLQALFHVPSLANWLICETQHTEACDAGSNSCIICAMVETLKQSQCNASSMKPFLVYSKLKMICKHMIMGRQEDAHEFLRFLVEAMEKSFLHIYHNHREFDQYTKETTPISQILGGYLKSAVRCLSCNHVSVTFQHFQDVLLDIRRADSIDEALESYFAREHLEDTGYKCEACKKKVSATKQFSLERAPIVMCLQLKRFSVNGTKLNKLISLRTRLDLTKYAAKKVPNNNNNNNNQQLTYRLVSMITHLGSSQHCGHYTAIGLTDTGSYYNFDDNYVRPVNVQHVCSTNAYVIFYELEHMNNVANGTKNGEVQTTTTSRTQMSHNQANGKLNGILLSSGTTDYNNRSCALTVLKPRFIGPLLPQNGLSSSTTNTTVIRTTPSPPKPAAKVIVALSSPQTQPQTQTQPVAKQQQIEMNNTDKQNGNGNANGNGLLLGSGKFQERQNARNSLASTSNKEKAGAIPNHNNSSCADNFGEITDSDDDECNERLNNNNNNSNSNSNSNANRNVSSSASESGGDDELKCLTREQSNALPHMPLLETAINSYTNHVTTTAVVVSAAKTTATATTTTSSLSSSATTQSTQSTKHVQKEQQVKSLVPYESASEEEEAPKIPMSQINGIVISSAAGTGTGTGTGTGCATGNTLKRANNDCASTEAEAAANENENNEEQQQLTANTNGSSSSSSGSSSTTKYTKQTSICSFYPPICAVSPTSSSKKPKTEIDEIFNKKKKQLLTPIEEQQQQQQQQKSVIIKSKTGPWQVTTTNTDEVLNTTGNTKKNSTPIKNHKNPFAVRTQTTTDSKKQKSKLEKSMQNYCNGGQREEPKSTPNRVVSELLKQSHRGYGAPVHTWNGKASEIDMELAAETREQRERDYEHKQENDIDAGRQRSKAKTHKDESMNYVSSGGSYNPFQEAENRKRWHQQQQRGGGGGGGYHHRVLGVKHLSHRFPHRNKFKSRTANRFNQQQQQQQQQQQRSTHHSAGRDRHFST